MKNLVLRSKQLSDGVNAAFIVGRDWFTTVPGDDLSLREKLPSGGDVEFARGMVVGAVYLRFRNIPQSLVSLNHDPHYRVKVMLQEDLLAQDPTFGDDSPVVVVLFMPK